ncbi:MAG: SpoIIE family protein phosphatase [Ignavibacteria bacterium]|nr:SpoIIE family protein phosphatase [Ignavibacteria bacterium]
MKLIEKISESNLRFFIILFAFICLILNVVAFENNLFSRRMTTDDCLWVPKGDSTSPESLLMITQIIPGGVADQAGLKDGDLLIAINGKKFSNTLNAMDILNEYSNQFVTYTVLRNNIILNIDIWVYKFVSVSFLIFWIVGLAFLFVGSLVGYSKPKELTSRLFFFFSSSASIGLVLYSGINPAGSLRLDTLSGFTGFLYEFMNRIYALAMVLIPALYVHFFLTFPNKYEFKRRKLFLWVIYIIVLIPLLFIYVSPAAFQKPLSIYLTKVIPVLYFIIGTRFFRRSSKRVTDPGLKKSLSIISKGFMFGGLGISYYLIFTLVNKDPYFLVNPLYLLPNILILAIPISFGFSIIKYRILDTEFIVKKSIIFGIVTLFIITVYLVLVYLMNSYFKGVFKGSNQLLIITFIIIFTFSFDFVNKYAKEFVDKQFYRERYNYRKSLLNFTKETSYINNIEDLVKSIREFLRDTVGISAFNLRVFNLRYLKALDLSVDKSIDEILKRILTNKNEPVLVNALKISELGLTEYETDLLKARNIKLLIPIYLKDELMGTISFGDKKSGKAFSDEDIDLLKSFASQSAICLENTRLLREQADKQKYEEEVNIAARIQNSLLPKSCEIHPRLEICGFSKPAENIGGDFYDIIRVSENKILVAIADVSDKGIPAALYMSQVQAMIQFAANIFESPKEILIEINKQIFDQLDKYSFVTALIAIFDLEKNKVKIARAGHSPLILIRDNSIERIYSKGIGIGLEKDALFTNNINDVELDIKPNDLYFMYSDGLSEAMNSNKELYTAERLEQKLLNLTGVNTETIKNDILDDVDIFRGNTPINDDITFVALKVK